MKISLVLFLLSIPLFAIAQETNLSDSIITTAIDSAKKNPKKDFGLYLDDRFHTLGNSTGFVIAVYSPTTWIQRQVASAAKEFRNFGLSDVTDEMRRPILRVVAEPDMPRKINVHGENVAHIVLRDLSGKMVIQPDTKETFQQSAGNAFGANVSYLGLIATFSLDKIVELRGPKLNQEFYITVIGEGHYKKDFKIQTKHFHDLP